MMFKSSLICIALLAVALVSTQELQKQFRLCVLKSKPTECKNLDRAGSGVKCVPVEDSTDCALKLQNRTADFGMFEPEQAILTSHFLEGVSVIGDIRHEERTDHEFSFTAVALARRKSVPGNDLSQVKNLTLCHPGMGIKHSGWSDAVLKAMDLAILNKNGNLKCDDWRSALQNEYFSIADHWGHSCRPGTWSWDEDIEKSLKSDYKSLCSKCPNALSCSYNPNEQSDLHVGVLNCLKNNGDVAYLSLEKANSFLQNTSNAGQDFAFVCPNLSLGNSAKDCNFAQQPWSSIVALKEVANELAPKLNEWLQPLDARLSAPEIPERAIGGWQRALIDLLLDNYHHYNSLLPQTDLKTFVGRGRKLKGSEPVVCDRKVRWCLQNISEKPKCSWMSAAAWYAGVTPPIECVVEKNTKDCVHKVSQNGADIVVADIDLTSYARGTQKLQATRFVETPNDKLNSVVAVLNANSDIKSFNDLKSKKACFPSYEGIGYNAFLKEGFNRSLVQKSNCPYYSSVDDFFGDTCVPGAYEFAENKPGLCALCEKAGGHTESCSANENNVNYGDMGAMKCLKSGGDVAFVRLQRILEAFQKNLLNNIHLDEFKVLCRQEGESDSTLVLGPNAVKCALVTVPSHAVLTRQHDEVTKDRDINIVLSSLDTLFGLDETRSHSGPTFHIFHPFGDNPSVIFPEGGNSLVHPGKQEHSIMQYQQLVAAVPHPCGGTSSAFTVAPRVFMTVAVTTLAFIFSR